MSLKVHVFDNDESLLDFFNVAFSSLGHQFEGATQVDPCKLITSAQKPCPELITCADAVLIDIRLIPQGISTLKRLQENGCEIAKRNLAVMGTTLTVEQKQTIQKLGYFALKKPFRLQELHDWIGSCAA